MSMFGPLNRRARRSAARSRRGRRALVAVGLMTVLTTLTQVPVSAAPPSDKAATAALDALAKETGRGTGELEILSSATTRYPAQGKSATDVKVRDRRTGEVHLVTVGDGGQAVDGAALDAGEVEASRARGGRVHPVLADRLSKAGLGERVPVVIWLNEPTYVAPQRPTGDVSDAQVEAFLARADQQRAAAVARVNEPGKAALRGLGHGADADAYAPALYAEVPAAAVRAISELPIVNSVYLRNTNVDELDIARPTITATPVHTSGITGTGVKVAAIEVGGRIATANPNLTGAVQDTTSVCATASGHSTAVAGIIRSTHATHKGIAPAASLRAGGSCSGNSAELQSRSTAAADWGASALNLSWGSNIGLAPGADDKFYDNLVINRFRTVVKSAGNRGTTGCTAGTDGNVTSPGLAYNVVTVGNFNDKNTVSWTGDTMDPCSSWRDPTSAHNDREKPEVSAPGANINSTTVASPWVGAVGSGTSFAAPMVTGTAALMMQKNASLKVWPEAVKAILQASAVHNIEGSARLSEFDGAGGIDAQRAVYAAGNTNGSGWGSKSFDCAQPASQDVQTVTLTAGKRARIATAWDNDPAYASYASKPSADLDLSVISPSGAVVTSSTSWDNTYEIVDFTPTVTGSYKIRVNKVSCALSPRFLGWAWSNA